MNRRRFLALSAVAIFAAVAQSGRPGGGVRRWAQYEREMQDPAEDPPDAWEETEFAFARLRYRSGRDGWRARWGVDANKSDRQFIQGVRRLTRIHARSVEHIVDIDTEEMFNWPFLYAVGIGDWNV